MTTRSGARPLAGLARTAALLLAAPLPQVAAQGSFEMLEGALQVETESPLPSSVSRGMAPLYVTIRSELPEAQSVRITFEPEHWSLECRILQTVEVPAGGEVRAELLVPSWTGFYGGNFVLDAGVARHRTWLRPEQGQNPGLVRPVLVVRDGAAAADLEGWNEALATGEVKLGSETLHNVACAGLAPEDLPQRFESYSGLAGVVVDTTLRVGPRALAPARRYARLGGTLILSGPDAREVARADPALAAWMEPRFRVRDAPQEAAAVYQFGLGTLVVGEAPEFLAPAQREAFRWGLFEREGFVPLYARPRPFLRELEVPGVRELPYRLFIVMLVAFCLAIGPLNFVLLKRAGRPAWLLFTIPALALVASTGFLAYGVFYQGVDLREASESFTVLDQREHRSDSLALRSLFAGLAPADGLRPGPGTLVLPAKSSSGQGRHYFEVDMGNELVLRGDFLPVRKEGTQVILSEASARGRLQVERTGRGLRVTNGLGAPIERLAVRDGRGGLYVLDPAPGTPPLEPGGAAELELHTGLAGVVDLVAWLPDPLDGRDLGWAEDLPPDTYLALLPSNPLLDGCGLRPDRTRGSHAVFGVLAAGALAAPAGGGGTR